MAQIVLHVCPWGHIRIFPKTEIFVGYALCVPTDTYGRSQSISDIFSIYVDVESFIQLQSS